jgi:hypothetical protein
LILSHGLAKMRGTPASLVGLAVLLGFTNAQSAYENTCNSPPVGDSDIEPSIVATYSCATWYHMNHSAGKSVPAGTPEECANECSKRSPEGPCTWWANTCYFFNAGAPTVAASGSSHDAVAIETRKDWNKLKAAYGTCQATHGSTNGLLPIKTARTKNCGVIPYVADEVGSY